MMKICMFGNADDFRVQDLAEYFQGRGYDILLLSPEITGRFSRSIKTRIITNGKLFPPFVYLYRTYQIVKNLREFRPDFFFIDTIYPLGIYSLLTGYHPVVLSAWGSDISTAPETSLIKKGLIILAIKRADILRVHDEAAKHRIIELGGKEEKIITHVRGIKKDFFSGNSAIRSSRVEDSPANTISIVSLRKLKPYYDVITLINAVPDVISQFPKARFILCEEGVQKEDLISLTRQLGIEKSVTFPGHISHNALPGLLRNSDIFIDTYCTANAGGGIGGGLMEAMVCGLVPVVARRPGIEFGVQDGINGLHFTGGDPRDLAEKIIWLLRNRDKMREFGENGRKYMIPIADFDKNMKIFDAQLQKKLLEKAR